MDEGDLPSLNQDLSTVFETIFLFLQNQHFFKSSEVFKTECESYGIPIPNISGKVFFSTKETLGSLDRPTSKGYVDKRVILETFIQKEKYIKPNDVEGTSENPDSLKTKFKQLQKEYKQLLGITSELTNALQLNIMGQARNMNYVLDHCKLIYPSLFPLDTEKLEETFTERKQDGSKSEMDVTMNLDDQCEKKDVRKNTEIPVLNLETSRLGSTNSEENQRIVTLPHTPLTEREIRDILETVLKRVIHVLDANDIREKSDYTDRDTVSLDHKTEISRILETVLMKVLESPRNYSSGRCSCSTTRCNSKLNQEPMGISESISSEQKYHQYVVDGTATADNKSANTQRYPTHIGMARSSKQEEENNNLENYQEEKVPARYLSSNRETSPEESQAKSAQEIANSHFDEVKNEIRKTGGSHSKQSKEENNKKHYSPIKDTNISADTDHTTNKLKPTRVVTRTFMPKQQLHSFPKTSFCYMEQCRMLENNIKSCRCMACNPGQSRYYCGCYDVICDEISAEISEISKEQASIRANYFKLRQNKSDIGMPTVLDQYLCGNRCRLCNGVCKCAFESRPKIQRSPPE